MSRSDTTEVSEAQQVLALDLVAEWMGKKLGEDGPVPTGPVAAHQGRGPVLIPNYEGLWTPQPPTPAIILEGWPGADWAVQVAEELRDEFARLQVFAEPLTGYILQLHPTN